MQKAIFVLFLCVMLSACGFKLRGQVAMPEHMQSIYIDPNNPYSPMQRELRQTLRLSGVNTQETAENVYTLRLLGEELHRENLIIGTDGTVKQEQLTLSWRYQILTPDGEPMPEHTASTQRVLNVNENQVLGQNQEEDILMREMRSDLAQQMLRRLSAMPAS